MAVVGDEFYFVPTFISSGDFNAMSSQKFVYESEIIKRATKKEDLVPAACMRIIEVVLGVKFSLVKPYSKGFVNVCWAAFDGALDNIKISLLALALRLGEIIDKNPSANITLLDHETELLTAIYRSYTYKTTKKEKNNTNVIKVLRSDKTVSQCLNFINAYLMDKKYLFAISGISGYDYLVEPKGKIVEIKNAEDHFVDSFMQKDFRAFNKIAVSE